jgi:transcriptional regulator with XRE-family HTH domain
MTRRSRISSREVAAWTISARSLTANGPLIEADRKARGWTREEFAWQTGLAVERIVQAGTADGRFIARYKRKKRHGKFVGLGATTLASAANSNPVYASTLNILAETFGVPVRSLIHPDDPSGENAPPASTPLPIDMIVDNVIGSAKNGQPAMTAYELTMILRRLLDISRKLLDRLVPPQDSHGDEG